MTDFPEFELPLKIAGGIDQIPAQYRGFYSQAEDGSGLELNDPVLKRRLDDTGLRTALSKEREMRKGSVKRAKEHAVLLADIISKTGAADIDELPGRLDELVTRSSPASSDATRREIEHSLKSTYGARLSQSEQENAKLKASLNAALIDNAVSNALATSGAMSRGAGGTGGNGQAAYSAKDWREKMARAKPEERSKLMRDAAEGRIVIRD